MTYSSSSANGSGQSPETILTLIDEQGLSLDCLVQSTIQADGQSYALLIPVDTPVEILTWPDDDDTDEAAVFVESSTEIDAVFPTACVVLEEQNLTLKRTALALTVEGEIPDPPETDEPAGNGDSDEGETEEMLWLVSFYHDDQEYGVYVPLDPFFILARLDDQGRPQLLSGEELEELEPFLDSIEDQLFDGL
ncbi:MAG: DUF3727 domain-containing protein [Microcoleaceae cyanobacterium]